MKRLIFTVCIFIMSLQLINAQTKLISGTVKSSDDGMGMPGVSVVIKGTTSGTSTNIDGEYTISAEPTDYIVYSFVGMVTQEILVGDQTVIDVTLSPESIGMDEVVVVGYGKQIKSEMTGAITKVSAEKLQDVPVPSFESALHGKTAGVFIEKASGKLGEAIKMRVRGSSSISADNQPLYVLDGIPIISQDQGIGNNSPTNPLNTINFSEIESIQILKDASAAAIYGSRAANGVVILTSKKGKEGKTKINLSYSKGFSKAANKVDFLNAAEYRELYGEAAVNAGYFASNEDAFADGSWFPGWLRDGGEGVDVDWQDEVFRTGSVENLDLSASGGSKNTQFYASFSRNYNKGIIIKNDFTRTGGRLNLDHTVNEKLKIGVSGSLVKTELDRVANDNAFSTPMQMVALAPVNPTHDPETGELNTRTIYYNGLISARDNFVKQEVTRTIGNMYAQYKILPELNFRTEYGLDNYSQLETSFQGRETNDGAPSGNASVRNVRSVNQVFNNYFTFNKEFNQDHTMEVTMGMTYEETKDDNSTVTAIGFPSDDFQTLNSGAETSSFGGVKTEFSFLSYFIRSNYKFKDRYLVNGSFRRDGSSRFGEDKRFGNFFAGSLGWIVSRESFLADKDWLSFLKLRGSYGVVGNAGISNFASRGLYQGSYYTTYTGIRPTQLPNPDLKWETTSQLDIGVDFGFFNNRINGEFDVYYKKTKDLLLNQRLPATSGFTSITKNVGELENKGIEFSINTNNLIGEFKWNTSFNISFNKNEITKLPGGDIVAGVNRVMQGESIGVFYTRKYAGVNPDNGHALYYVEEGSSETTDDYNAAANMVVGDPNPDFVGGITNSFSYKGFDLDVVMAFVYGNDVYNGGGQYQSNQASSWKDNQTRDQLNRWQQPGDITDVPQAWLGGNQYSGTDPSSRYLSDASYLRIKNVTLGYNFPQSVLNTLKLSNLRVYVTAVNLYTFTDYKGWDPEVNFAGVGLDQTNTNVIQGRDFYTAPQARTISFGVNIGL
ncbi:SusC/RagA family TonB-linked outer membrane protein [Marinifilum flexuosum]|uniref:TonB-linked SusC/RagA family outer membrane protein n=1 Tax=Marinifilum flexuosum TaxID=1117708 RepID=A0A419WN86_9BACT|nr:TonB-dependent receptor [Marinifilum flexuosum]RKD96902.1 TonB-linked SusC/RagA family outer membrane protein [Marinifilum flexuosum]